MNFWQDDNAVMFKLQNLQQEAGFLGKGFLGEGPYRYTATVYLPIYRIFHNNEYAYFVYMLVFFLFSIIFVYFLFNTLLDDEKTAFMASFLYACGYIASEGFFRMFNSVLTSITVILASLTLICFYNFYSRRKIIYLGLGLLFSALSLEIGFVRMHYFMFVLIMMEIVFSNVMTKRLRFKQVFFSFLRILLFTLMFYYWYGQSDSRSSQVNTFIQSLAEGKLENLFGFFSSLGNILLPNQIFAHIFQQIDNNAKFLVTDRKLALYFALLFLFIAIVLKRLRIINFKVMFVGLLSIFLTLMTGINIANSVTLDQTTFIKVSFYAGIFFINLVVLLYKNNFRLKFFLFFWIILNLSAYSAYDPVTPLRSDNRYLLHSFIPFAGLFSVMAMDLRKRIKLKYVNNLPLTAVIIYGVLILISSVWYQNEILRARSYPTKDFLAKFKQEKLFIAKNDVIYFFVAKDQEQFYSDLFTVAQMPDEASLAWRYGVDRYDFKIVRSYEELINEIGDKKQNLDQIFAFIVRNNSLVNVTDQYRQIMSKGSNFAVSGVLKSNYRIEKQDGKSLINLDPVNIKAPLVSALLPLEGTLLIKASPPSLVNEMFPLFVNAQAGELKDLRYKEPLLKFLDWRNGYYAGARIATSSHWKDRTENFLIDRNDDTYWQANRVSWGREETVIELDLGKIDLISGLVFKYGPQLLIPTQFRIGVSQDGEKFEEAKQVQVSGNDVRSIRIVEFSETKTRYIRIYVDETLGGDSPAISEIYPLPKELLGLDLNLLEKMLSTPFAAIDTKKTWDEFMKNFLDNAKIKLEIIYDSDKNNQLEIFLPIRYDGLWHNLEFDIPEDYKSIQSLKLEQLTIPGEIEISKVELYRGPMLLSQ